MFGQNPILKAEQGDGKTLRVVKGSPFLTIQGEGPYMGQPAVFIRLHGCNLACTFCDTQFSDPDDPVSTINHLCQQVVTIGKGVPLVVITGGEPFRQNIRPLCQALHELGFKIQIETAGTLWVEGVQHYAEIVCSPKTPNIHPRIMQAAMVFKYVVDVEMTFDKYIPITATQAGARPARLAEPRYGVPVYLSPMDMNEPGRNAQNCGLVARLAIAHNCIAGLQMHKYMGVD